MEIVLQVVEIAIYFKWNLMAKSQEIWGFGVICHQERAILALLLFVFVSKFCVCYFTTGQSWSVLEMPISAVLQSCTKV